VVSADLLKARNAPAGLGHAVAANLELFGTGNAALDPELPADASTAIVAAAASFGRAVGQGKHVLSHMGAREGGLAESRFFKRVGHDSLSVCVTCDCAVMTV
jgi:hypothetical protein